MTTTMNNRTTSDWKLCAAADIATGNRLFDELYPLVNECLRGVGVKAGIHPEESGVTVCVPEEGTSGPCEELAEVRMGRHTVTSLKFRKHMRDTRGRRREMAITEIIWDVIESDGSVRETPSRVIRISCSDDHDDRELSVDIPGSSTFSDHRWSPYGGLVKLNPDDLRYRIPDVPEGADPIDVNAVTDNCRKSLDAGIEALATFAEYIDQNESGQLSASIANILDDF